MTNEKIIAANALYHECLTIQNAARLQYPGGKDASGNARNVTERARFPSMNSRPATAPNRTAGRRAEQKVEASRHKEW